MVAVRVAVALAVAVGGDGAAPQPMRAVLTTTSSNHTRLDCWASPLAM